MESSLGERISALAEHGITPHLAVVIAGGDPASQVYVAAKQRACERLGIRSSRIDLPPDCTSAEMLAQIELLAQDDSVNGMLVQSPLPDGHDEIAVTDLIPVEKDVDGFSAINLGRLVQGKTPELPPCTPAGVIELLRWAGIELPGLSAVVIGRSRIVGMPLALLLAQRGVDATVTIAHSRTADLAGVCSQADILIAAVGRPNLVAPEWVKPGAVVIDVGVNRIVDPDASEGRRLAGDVHPDVAGVASWLSPVPGGVGPMTIAMLMSNTVKATELQHRIGR